MREGQVCLAWASDFCFESDSLGGVLFAIVQQCAYLSSCLWNCLVGCRSPGRADLENHGGLHFIETFVSSDVAEEVQIKGRTAMQGKRGSHYLVVTMDSRSGILDLVAIAGRHSPCRFTPGPTQSQCQGPHGRHVLDCGIRACSGPHVRVCVPS